MKTTKPFFANESTSATLVGFCNDINIGADGWAMIAPFGDHPSPALFPDGKGGMKKQPAIQRIDKTGAEMMVASFHNEQRGFRKFIRGCNIYVGHPHVPGLGKFYPDKEPKGVFADLAVREHQLGRDVDAAADALIALAMAFESHDRSTAGHSERVAGRAVAIAKALGLDSQTQQTIRVGALLRDIGNTKLPLGLVRSRGELTPVERTQIEQHPALGQELLAAFRPLARLLPIVRSHHEHLDGSGYPDGLKAPQIPLEVRIVAVADRYEALRIARADRPAMSADAAVQILQQSVQRGELDAAVVAALAAGVRAHDRGEATGS